MKLEINDRGDSKFYDEVLSITYNYNKILKNPRKKIYPLRLDAIKYGIISLILFISYSFLAVVDNNFKMNVILMYSFLILIILSIIYYIVLTKRIKDYKNKKGIIKIIINKKEVEYKDVDNSYRLRWNNIKYIIINKRTISFIPSSRDNYLIMVNIKYKKEIIDEIKNLGKEELLIDNNK